MIPASSPIGGTIDQTDTTSRMVSTGMKSSSLTRAPVSSSSMNHLPSTPWSVPVIWR